MLWILAVVQCAWQGQTFARGGKTLADPCVWKEIDKYPECSVFRNMSSNKALSLAELKVVCNSCIPTVNYYLGLDDVGLCTAYMDWAAGVSKTCHELGLRTSVCPDVAVTGCQELLDLGIETWVDGIPPKVYPLETIVIHCTPCLKAMNVPLVECPRAKFFDGAMRPVCESVIHENCFVNAYKASMSGQPCDVTVGIMEQFGLQRNQRETCGKCLPFMLDLTTWKQSICPTETISTVTNRMKIFCMGSDQCVADFLLSVSRCDKLASIVIGRGTMTQEECTLCLTNAFSVHSKLSEAEVRGCPTLYNSLLTYDTQCKKGGFPDVKCGDLLDWLDGNHTREIVSTASPTLTATLPTATVTLTLSETGIQPYDAPVPQELPSGPCFLPHSCECANAISDSFNTQWTYYLGACGLNIEERRRECLCSSLKSAFYFEVPQCIDIFELPDFTTLCSVCQPQLLTDKSLSLINSYYRCLGEEDKTLTLVHWVKAVCSPGGIGAGNCPPALLSAKSLPHCSGAFYELLVSGKDGGPFLKSEGFRDFLCTNGTQCTTDILRDIGLTANLLADCNIEIYLEHTLCKCWSRRTAFLTQAPHCRVLIDHQWQQNVLNFTRLCDKCLSDLASFSNSLSDYGQCTGKGEHYSYDIEMNVRAACERGYLGPHGYNTPSVHASACQLHQDGSSGCLAVAMCRIEDYVPECRYATVYPDWRFNTTDLKLVCTSCVGPMLNTSQVSQALNDLVACDATWDVKDLAILCQDHVDVCLLRPALCSVPMLVQSCSASLLETAGQQWSICLSKKRGGQQCSCAQQFKDATTGCSDHPLLQNWLCVVKGQGCPGIPYPSVGAEECRSLVPLLGWNTMDLEAAFAICPLEVMVVFHSNVSECLTDMADICACVSQHINALPVGCMWDATGKDVDRVRCYMQQYCSLSISSEVCNQLSIQPSDSLIFRVHRARLCNKGMATTVSHAINEWYNCAQDACSCFAVLHYKLQLVPDCVSGSPEWETLRCWTLDKCGYDGRFTPPDAPTECHHLIAHPDASTRGHRLVWRMLDELPVCDWTDSQEYLDDFHECLHTQPKLRVNRCECVTALAWSVPLSCKFSNAALWMHVMCLSSDLGCRAIPYIQAHTCDDFYAEFQDQPPAPLISAADSKTNRLNASLYAIPSSCVSGAAVLDSLRQCQSIIPKNNNFGLAVCGCLYQVYTQFKICKTWQPLALEAVMCQAFEWQCYGIPTPADGCPGLEVHEIEEPHEVCATLSKVRPTGLTCEEQAAYRASIPYVCRRSPPGDQLYQSSLCESFSQGCVSVQPPQRNCVRALVTVENTKCKQLLLMLGKRCKPLFDFRASREEIASACSGECGTTASKYRGTLSAFCSSDDFWHVKWLQVACLESDGMFMKTSITEFRKRFLVQQPKVPPSSGIAKHFIGQQTRLAFLGKWQGYVEPLPHWTPFTTAQVERFCTPVFMRAINILAGHASVKHALSLCTPTNDPRPGFSDYVFCASTQENRDQSTMSGIESICADKCTKRSEQATTIWAPQIDVCERDATGALCMTKVMESGAGVGGVSGTPFLDGAYPNSICNNARWHFEQCRRNGVVSMCDCVRALSNALPGKACLAHIDVAPSTLCLLNPLDVCLEQEFRTEYLRYCSQSMQDDLKCREIMWNENMPCTGLCRTVFIRYVEQWGCCAGAFNDMLYLRSDGGASLKNVETSCGITFLPHCSSVKPSNTFNVRLVLNMNPDVVNSHRAAYDVACRRDIMRVLGIKERNILGVLFDVVSTSFTLKRQAVVLNSTRLISLTIFLRGDHEAEAAILRKDMIMFLANTLPHEHIEQLYLKHAGLQAPLNAYLSKVSDVGPLQGFARANELPETVASVAPVDTGGQTVPTVFIFLFPILVAVF
eukprot:TRINITY_DN12662_c0_g1_i1.p1 TRINITY_DN12662_c0_g1~~TRINITY_DN12662_c0_g1_i1.p1  ORF type:complete len:1884 (+),score=41.74 TRINITY_DN12662_c0_g1_i1:31-5682(+)